MEVPQTVQEYLRDVIKERRKLPTRGTVDIEDNPAREGAFSEVAAEGRPEKTPIVAEMLECFQLMKRTTEREGSSESAKVSACLSMADSALAQRIKGTRCSVDDFRLSDSALACRVISLLAEWENDVDKLACLSQNELTWLFAAFINLDLLDSLTSETASDLQRIKERLLQDKETVGGHEQDMLVNIIDFYFTL